MTPEDPVTDPSEPTARSAGPEVSLVVPFFNPGPSVLRDTLARSAAALEAAGATFEVIAVSDGSTDGSAEALTEDPAGWLQAVVLPDNRGKGHALRVGFARARGAYVGFIDADGEIPPEVLGEFVRVARAEHPDLISGSKRHPESEARYPAVRRLYSRGYQRLVRLLFDLDVVDTQTGVKLVSGPVMAVLLPRLTEDRYALDLELFVRAHQAGFDRVVELPVRIEKRAGSTVSLRSVRSILVDTLRIFWRARVRRRGPAPPRPAATPRDEPQSVPRKP
ncbi:MAG TPA: glycosyltransferase [Acidimicrobiales bacterium]|nr:glycosyltransferase [Acidimicrobiales bacterium]